MEAEGSAEITGLLKAGGAGDTSALDRLTELVHRELRNMARRYMKDERARVTLQATALVNEVYIRLVDVKNIDWESRAQFFALSAQLMRRILVDAARARGCGKRGGDVVKIDLNDTAVVSSQPDKFILDLDEALEALSRIAPRQAKVVELRYFAGMSDEESAEALFGGDLATTYNVLNKCFPMVYVFEYFDAVNAEIQTAGGTCIWSAAGREIDAVNIHAEPPIASCNDNHFPCLVKALAWDPTQFKMNYPAGMSQAAVVLGTAASLGVDDADMYGIQGAPQTCTAVAPKSTPPGCLTMTSSDPGSCAQVIVTG